MFGPQLSIFYYLVLVHCIQNENLEILFFSGRIVLHFHKGKSSYQGYLQLYNFYLSTLFTTFGMQMDNKIIFVSG